MSLRDIVGRVIREASVSEKLLGDCSTGQSSQYKDLQRSLDLLLLEFTIYANLPSKITGAYTHHITYLGQGQVGIIIGRPVSRNPSDETVAHCQNLTNDYKDFLERCDPLNITIMSYLPTRRTQQLAEIIS